MPTAASLVLCRLLILFLLVHPNTSVHPKASMLAAGWDWECMISSGAQR
jgi:hypothetical protein